MKNFYIYLIILFWPLAFLGQTTPSCGDNFYDTGGPNGDFQNNEDYTVTIMGTVPGTIVTATFTSVDNTTFDILTVDIGDGNPPVVVQDMSANDPPVSYTSVAADGSLIFHFTSSGVVQNPGWEASISCSPPPSCILPSNVQNIAVTDITADFSWDAETTATTGYNWVVMVDGDDPDVDTPVTSGSVATGTTMTQVTSLVANTIYDFYVQSDCGATNGLSNWSNEVDFTTNCSSQLSGTYTIGATGDYTTITDAAAVLSECGVSGAVTFNVLTGSGPYNEQIAITEITGSSATNTVTFNGNGETLTSTTESSSRNLFLLDGADYVTIDNFNFVTQDVDYNFVIQLTNGANFNTISNNTIDLTSAINDTGSDNAGIVVSGSLTSATSDGDSGDVTITGNTIIGGYYGISISGSASGSSMNNIVSDNTVQDFYYHGIYNNDVENTTISNNDLHRENRTDVSVFYALYFTGNGGGNVIDSNKLHDAFTGDPTATNTAYPIYHTSTDAPLGNPNIVSNNIIYNINGAGGTNYAIYNSGSDGVYYYHNTISLDFSGATSGTTRGFYQTTTASDIEFKNNIISITRGGSGTKYCIYFNTAGSTISSNNNVFYMNSAGGTTGIGYFGSSAQTTLSDWQTASGGDANSIAVDPVFAAPLTGQFNPTVPAVDNIGTPVGILTDINGNTRSTTTPDAGAFEFSPPSCFQPSGLDATNIDGFSADLSWAENNTPAATLWEIEYDLTGFTPTGTPNVTGVNQNPYNLSALTPLTSYDYYVRANCGAGSFSAWTGPYTFVTGCATQLSGTYTIGATGDYTTITDAVDELNLCGVSGAVTFNVLTGSGPYNEQIAITEITGSSATNTVTFNGNGETLTSATESFSRNLFLLDGADYVTIDNFNFVTQDVDYNFVIQLTNGANFNTISNNTIDLTSAINDTGSDNAGIVVSGSLTSATSDGDSGDVTITGNTIIGGYYGISISGSASGSSMNNIVSDNTVQDFYYYGIYNNDVENTTISNNNLHRENRTDVSNFYALYFTGNGGGNVVDANELHDAFTGEPSATSTAYPIYHNSTDAPLGNHNIVSNNIIYNINGAGGTNYAIYNSGSDGVYYYHNTISLDFPGATSGITRGFYQTTTASDIEFKNNIISITRGGSGTKYCIYFNTAGSTISSDNNVFYMNSSGGTTGIGYFGSSAQTTLSDWQTASGGDANSIAIDPLFAAPLTGQLTPNSAAIDDQGTPLGILTDINGNTRSTTTPDIGAIEFVSTETCVLPTNIMVSGITTTSADFSWTASPDETNGYEYIVMLDGDDPELDTPADTGILATGTTTLTVSNLSPGVNYDFYLRTVCNGFNGPWSTVVDFTTALPPCDLPTGITNTAVSLTTADFSWTASADETDGYIWLVMADGDDPLVDMPIDNGTVATGVTTVQVTGLTPGTNYDFYIQTDCGGGTVSILSIKVDFVTDNFPCTPPASISNNAITATTAKLTWQTNGLETGGYNWVLMADGDDPTTDMPLFNGSVGTGVTSVVISGLTPMTDYDFYVQTVCATEDSGWSSKVDVKTTAPPCAAPSGVTNTDIQSSTADFSWTASPDESNGYNWVLMAEGDDPTTDTPLFNASVGTGVTSAMISGLASMTDYDFYVQTNCSSGNLSDWSPKVDITTLASACAAPTGVTNTDVQNTTADFSWTASSDETDGYSWFVMIDGENPMVDLPIQQGTVSTGTTSAQVTGLTKDTNYDFYVRTDCGSGNLSDWSTKVDFTTTNLRVVNSNFQNFSYYPNPVKTSLILEAAGEQLEKVSVYNLLGQQVITLQPNSIKANVNLDRLAAGPYMVKVTIGGETKTFKVIKE